MAQSHEPLSATPVTKSLAAVAFLVPDYDDAIAWFRAALDFDVIEDRPLGADKRWVVVAPPGSDGARLVLARAADARQREAIGAAAGGRIAYFLETDDFARDHAAMSARGVRFLESPRREVYGTVAVFADPWGGRWDLLQPVKRQATVAP
jgi:catechol 2,3-dioxygenase-like lactoylglutathione lyase family enzyme